MAIQTKEIKDLSLIQLAMAYSEGFKIYPFKKIEKELKKRIKYKGERKKEV